MGHNVSIYQELCQVVEIYSGFNEASKVNKDVDLLYFWICFKFVTNFKYFQIVLQCTLLLNVSFTLHFTKMSE